MPTALIAECLSQMRFPRPCRPDKGQIPVRVDRREGADALQLFQIRKAFASQHRKVKVVKGLGDLLRKPTHTKDGLDRRLLLFLPEDLKQGHNIVQRGLGEALLHREPRQLRGGKVQPEGTEALVDVAAEALIHPTIPPWRS